MTTFLESPRFPDNIAFKATVGPSYQTVINTVYSGRDASIVAWTQARIRFDVGRRSMNKLDTETLDAFFRAMKGRGYRFRIKDWTDFACTTANGVLTVQTPGIYQLGKLYVTGTLSETRTIAKPVAGTVIVYKNGVALSSGYSLDATTGLVTLTPSAQANITGVVVGSPTQVTLASALSGLASGGLLTLQGLSGANAGVLNNQSFSVTSISGSTYSLNVNTTGLAITPSGFAEVFPQPGDTLAWAGQFDVPVRFDTDEMKKQVMDRNGPNGDLLVDWGSIPIIEVRP